MNFSRKIYFLLLMCLISVSNVFPQKNKDKTPAPPFDVKANLLISDAEDYFVDDLKQEDVKIFEDGVEQKITYFAKKEPVLNLAIVVDNTGSMRMKLDEIIFASSGIASNLRPKDEALVIRFVDSVKIEVKQDWTSDQRKLNNAIQNLYIEGGQSAVLDAIYLAQKEIIEREKTDKTKRYAILLISDVEDHKSFYKYDEVLSLFKDSDSQVFILSYADGAPEKEKEAISLGHRIALDTGGTIHNLARKHTKEDLIEILKKLAFEFRSNYTIGYTPINQKRDGLQRKLTVEVKDGEKGEKRKTQIRGGFTVPVKK